MFLKYFQFSEQPFGTTPDPRFLFHSNSHREALASLDCAFHANRGFAALIAEPGMGKTTLLFEFLEHIRNLARTIFFFNRFCGTDDIVAYILRDSGVEPAPTATDRYRQMNELIGAEARKGRPVVLVIDEAQNLSSRALEDIRLLTNFETTRSKLIQVFLAGQPQLAEVLARPDLDQLRQRVFAICRIPPLSTGETRGYIEHRLRFAAYQGNDLFSAAALDLIAQASTGIPRVINTLCFNSLCLCRAKECHQVDEAMVKEAILDLELKDIPSSRYKISPQQQGKRPWDLSSMSHPAARGSLCRTTSGPSFLAWWLRSSGSGSQNFR
jgi:general secretion pathway protein A